jgi:prepilin-type N-terminal cleavage/methylation domain-containing protein
MGIQNSKFKKSMNNRQKTKRCFTLVEMLVVIAIVAILATMVVGIASRIETGEKEKHCRSALALLTTALAQFHEYGLVYKGSDYATFTFPLDCNGFSTMSIQSTLGNALGVGAENVHISGTVDPNEVTYLFLSMVPASRETLGKIDRKLIVSSTTTIGIGGASYLLFKVIDPWNTTLRYDYYDEQLPPITTAKLNIMKNSKKNFPLITSAGPDGKFGTSDDITSR